jgi:hypothetical protein
MLSRNSVNGELPQPAFPQKSFLGESKRGVSTNKVAPAPTSMTALAAEPKKEDEVRLEAVSSLSSPHFTAPSLFVSPAATVPKTGDETRLEELTAAEENNEINS